MSYNPTVWVDENTYLNADNLNKIEQGIKVNSDFIEANGKSYSELSSLDLQPTDFAENSTMLENIEKIINRMSSNSKLTALVNDEYRNLYASIDSKAREDGILGNQVWNGYG